MQNQLKAWMDKASPKQKKRLAELASTSLGALRQAAGAWRTEGLVNVTPAVAKRLEIAILQVNQENPDAALPVVHREHLCVACGQCELALKCREASQPVNSDK
jgi:hypothetical protein